MADNNDILFKQAMKRIDELVDEVLEICNTVAEENDYEKEWVLDMFKEKFNKVKR
jgi:hypothetical protein